MIKTLISEDEFLHRSLAVALQPLDWGLARSKDVEMFVRRDDLIDSACSGNKFYKLFYNLHAAKTAGYKKLLSFGGAYSNHIYALAATGAEYGFDTVGVIRGERPARLSATLIDAERMGMKLHFVSRTEYRSKDAGSPEDYGALLELLTRTHGDFYLIPEGGANAEGMQGSSVMGWAVAQQLAALPERLTQVCLACGTGNTLAGVASGLAAIDVGVTGFSVLKGEGDLGARIRRQQTVMANQSSNWRLISGYHGGGYARKLPFLLHQFGHEFEASNGLKLDPVYTLKMLWGVAQLMQQDYWPQGSRLVLIHTGGMQGRRGFDY